MIFNSTEFFLFFVGVFSIYYFFLKEKTRLQNILLLIASYVFYAYANWKLLPLLLVTTLIFYGLGIAVFEAKTDKRKLLFTTLGIIIGIGTLLYFKYFNFFISSFKDLFESFGLHTNLHTFNILVPIGISFYTFRLLSYIIDIQRGKIEPARDIIVFATYVAFFPCLLAGPIDRPATLIPQLQNKREFDYSLAVNGLKQILWGLFKKVVVADNCAEIVNHIFNRYDVLPANYLAFGAVLFSFQLYADFSGYSDMAIGVSKLLGFRVTKNFDYPFFAQNIAEYWRKWHISLTSWLTDYVFMPLNIKWRDRGKLGMIAAIIITFILIGLWHGDNWKFAIFGLYHGLLYIPLILTGAMFKKNKLETYKWDFPKFKVLFNIFLTFGLVTLGNIIFQSDNISMAFHYIVDIFSVSIFRFVFIENLINLWNLVPAILSIILLLLIEWKNRTKDFGLDFSLKSNFLRWAFYIVLILIIIEMGGAKQDFIYYQF